MEAVTVLQNRPIGMKSVSVWSSQAFFSSRNVLTPLYSVATGRKKTFENQDESWSLSGNTFKLKRLVDFLLVGKFDSSGTPGDTSTHAGLKVKVNSHCFCFSGGGRIKITKIKTV